ncbi:hypothetical protein AMS68_006630 [Peltaster fructicola]|uniref:Small secreted protein n=1 Tax=Peltaster fructicola TaxID=286661 RepID=A0A6H0Y265_9PEZI|nr:hypothetical protein AMS68_006630 [Peltaster fructicola]
MKCSIFLSTVLAGAALAANSKLNQYANINDCNNDKNIISHASPVVGSCHQIDAKTGAVYLVTGSGAAGEVYSAYANGGCSGKVTEAPVPEGKCVTLPAGTVSMYFGAVA